MSRRRLLKAWLPGIYTPRHANRLLTNGLSTRRDREMQLRPMGLEAKQGPWPKARKSISPRRLDRWTPSFRVCDLRPNEAGQLIIQARRSCCPNRLALLLQVQYALPTSLVETIVPQPRYRRPLAHRASSSAAPLRPQHQLLVPLADTSCDGLRAKGTRSCTKSSSGTRATRLVPR
jgi:hypothetical protein